MKNIYSLHYFFSIIIFTPKDISIFLNTGE